MFLGILQVASKGAQNCVPLMMLQFGGLDFHQTSKEFDNGNKLVVQSQIVTTSVIKCKTIATKLKVHT